MQECVALRTASASSAFGSPPRRLPSGVRGGGANGKPSLPQWNAARSRSKPAYVGTLGLELDTNSGQDAARIAALGALAAARNYLGTLDRIKRVVRLSVFMVASGNAVDQPAVANGASDLLRDVFGEGNMAVRSVIGVSSLPLGVPIELEIIFELNE